MAKNRDNILSPRTLNLQWLLPVLNNQNTPPNSMNDGDRYRVTSVASGAWTGKENNIAIWDADNIKWNFDILSEGQVWYDFTSQNWHYMSHAGVITQFDKIPLAISDVTGLQAALDGKASTTHHTTHDTGNSDAFTVSDLLDAIARIIVANGGVTQGTRRKINFIAGTNITLSCADDGAGEKVDVTINATTSAQTTFDDSLFNIFNHNDNTKKIAFDASVVPTATTRTLKPSAANGTIMTLENAETISATKTSSVNGDVLLPSVDGQGNIGNTGKRFAKVKAVIVESGDVILTDRKTGKKLYAIHEDSKGIYFSDFKTKRTKMFLNMHTGDLKITGKLIQNAKIAKKLRNSVSLK